MPNGQGSGWISRLFGFDASEDAEAGRDPLAGAEPAERLAEAGRRFEALVGKVPWELRDALGCAAWSCAALAEELAERPESAGRAENACRLHLPQAVETAEAAARLGARTDLDERGKAALSQAARAVSALPALFSELIERTRSDRIGDLDLKAETLDALSRGFGGPSSPEGTPHVR